MGRFDFATAMHDAVAKWGDLTEKQMQTVERCMARDAARIEARAAQRDLAKAINVMKIVEIFANARKALLKKPTMRVGELTLKLASEHSENPGCVYVTKGETYLGKIDPAGIFSPAYAATAEDIALIEATAANPLEMAVAYGRRTGSCACCGRTLTDKTSIERGIGPICETKWGL